jgi:hypothetical protein
MYKIKPKGNGQQNDYTLIKKSLKQQKISMSKLQYLLTFWHITLPAETHY